MAQSFMVAATTSATAGSSGLACSMVAINDLKAGFGSRLCMTALVKTFFPKMSPGASAAVKIPAGARYRLTAPIAARRAALPLIDRS